MVQLKIKCIIVIHFHTHLNIQKLFFNKTLIFISINVLAVIVNTIYIHIYILYIRCNFEMDDIFFTCLNTWITLFVAVILESCDVVYDFLSCGIKLYPKLVSFFNLS